MYVHQTRNTQATTMVWTLSIASSRGTRHPHTMTRVTLTASPLFIETQ